MSLKGYKKQELKDMLQKLSLSEEGLKNDLEDRLQEYLDKVGSALEELPQLQNHFAEMPVSPSTARKAARKSLAYLTSDDLENDIRTKASEVVTKTSEMLKPAQRRFEDATEDMEISPSKVAKWANDTKKRVLSNRNISKGVKALPLSVEGMQSQLSQVTTVAALSVIVEGAKMTKALVPISYEVKLAGLRSITLPDLFVFLSVNDYWKPILTWVSFQIIPLLFGVVFNLRADSVSKRYRKAHAMEYAFDPVTFAISKLLMVYLAFYTTFGSSIAPNDVGLVKYIIGSETFFIGTAITLVYSIYEAIL